MTKLIVEMEMPQACPCEFAYYSSHGIFRPCFAWNGIPARWHEVEKCAENGTRPDWCPIKGVLPEVHGDLIDRDVASEAFTRAFDEWDRDVAVFSANGVVGVLKSQQAVIEAERKDDEA